MTTFIAKTLGTVMESWNKKLKSANPMTRQSWHFITLKRDVDVLVQECFFGRASSVALVREERQEAAQDIDDKVRHVLYHYDGLEHHQSFVWVQIHVLRVLRTGIEIRNRY